MRLLAAQAATAVLATPAGSAMRLTRFTDNALRCLMYLGRNPGRVVTVGEVSQRMAMSGTSGDGRWS